MPIKPSIIQRHYGGDKVSSEKIKRNLVYLKRQIESIKLSREFDDIEYHWECALGNIYIIFENYKALCKANGEQKNIISKMISTFKTNETFRYLHQARNANTHTIQKSTVDGPTSTVLKGPLTIGRMCIDGGKIPVDTSLIKGDGVIFLQSSVKLLQVVNMGTTYDPPSREEGVIYSTVDLAELIEQAYEYFDEIRIKCNDF